jgi:hypothetical protein
MPDELRDGYPCRLMMLLAKAGSFVCKSSILQLAVSDLQISISKC